MHTGIQSYRACDIHTGAAEFGDWWTDAFPSILNDESLYSGIGRANDALVVLVQTGKTVLVLAPDNALALAADLEVLTRALRGAHSQLTDLSTNNPSTSPEPIQ